MPKASSSHVQIVNWIIVIFWMGVIFSLSSISIIPGPKVYFWDYLLKKTAHMAEYAILYYLVLRAVNYGRDNKMWHYGYSMVVTLVYAISDEIHQSVTPGRNPQPLDVYFDSLGAMTVYLRLHRLI